MASSVKLEDQISPREYLTYRAGDLSRLMLLREAVEVASLVLRTAHAAVTGNGDTRLGHLQRDDERRMLMAAWAAVDDARHVFEEGLGRWFTAFMAASVVDGTELRNPHDVLAGIRKAALAEFDAAVDRYLSSPLVEPWLGESYRTLIDHFTARVRGGERGLSPTEYPLQQRLGPLPAVEQAGADVPVTKAEAAKP